MTDPKDVAGVVKRLRERANGRKPVPDGSGGFRWETYHHDTELEAAATLIESLSAQVEEIRAWADSAERPVVLAGITHGTWERAEMSGRKEAAKEVRALLGDQT